MDNSLYIPNRRNINAVRWASLAISLLRGDADWLTTSSAPDGVNEESTFKNSYSSFRRFVLSLEILEKSNIKTLFFPKHIRKCLSHLLNITESSRVTLSDGTKVLLRSRCL